MGALTTGHSVFIGLTDKEFRFVHEYIIDYNASRALRAAGYSPKLAGNYSSALLKKEHIAKAIRHLEKKTLEGLILDAKAVRQKIAQILYFKPALYFEGGNDGWFADAEGMARLPDYVHEMITEVQRKKVKREDGDEEEMYWVKFMSKDAALALAARYTLGTEELKNLSKLPPLDFDTLYNKQADKNIVEAEIVEKSTPKRIEHDSSSD